MSKITLIVALGAMCFSAWLMWHTFSYNPAESAMLISSKVWSDFGWHIPLIRSFSEGVNWPPENPIFPGEKIRYHFVFYALVGLLERLGVRIDWAFNLLSSFGFAAMLTLLFVLTKKLFNNAYVGLLAVILLLFNGSLAFGYYFLEQGLSWQSIINILSNSVYPAFGPWDGSQVAAIWNLNVYTNQRHLAPAIALALFAIYSLLYRRVNIIIFGLLLGSVLLINQAIFAALAIYLFWHFIFYRSERKYLFYSALAFIPWIVVSWYLVDVGPHLQFKPGFLISGELTVKKFIIYWFYNFGLHAFLMPLGVLLAPKKLKYFGLVLLCLFAIPNLFQLSFDMFNNHKLFNFLMIFGVMFTAWSVWKLKILIVPLMLVLTFSGVIDFFATKNDTYLYLHDRPRDKTVEFINMHIPAGSVILNSTWFYHPANLAGKPIFSGYTYFTWSHGHDSYNREKTQVEIYRSTNRMEACRLLKENNIKFVELNDRPENYIQPNFDFWKANFIEVFRSDLNHLSIYDVDSSCYEV